MTPAQIAEAQKIAREWAAELIVARAERPHDASIREIAVAA
jgi:hypothetical protein